VFFKAYLRCFDELVERRCFDELVERKDRTWKNGKEVWKKGKEIMLWWLEENRWKEEDYKTWERLMGVAVK
jgi:hypothetical protein